MTTIQISHPELVPDGVFEYQHAFGDSASKSLLSGFTAFAEYELPVFFDALEAKPKTCTFLDFSFPSDPVGTLLARRAVLGPLIRYSNPPAEVGGEGCEGHCPCCFLTKNHSAFVDVMKSRDVAGIRFFVARDKEGQVSADCRINGEDYAPGQEALIHFGGSWPGASFEYRKQYILIHSTK